MPSKEEQKLLADIMEMIVTQGADKHLDITFNGMQGAKLNMEESANVGQLLNLIGKDLMIKSMSMAASLAHECTPTSREAFKNVILNSADDIHVHSVRCIEAIRTGEGTINSVIAGKDA